jgi:hypothetical protein
MAYRLPVQRYSGSPLHSLFRAGKGDVLFVVTFSLGRQISQDLHLQTTGRCSKNHLDERIINLKLRTQLAEIRLSRRKRLKTKSTAMFTIFH